MSTSLGKKIRDIREAEGLSRSQFAELTGVPEGAQKFYETDRRVLGSDTLLKITQHPRFEKYALWLTTDKTLEAAGQISPSLSPNGQDDTSNHQKDQKVG
ncbi:helix-turn-helix domain-containing protein [Serratia liquefaciens]|uniref:Helix-turn-helix transcriptional regulator n=1 Tax=Serratia liquefaciens TaxID=614 RepID=A0ABX7D9Y8_SERLI|nr:helix-turn-helix transcriptional regulator [Serratia liquefaciens]QQU56453.1 helix-turn-helix transcriptional regulator [Serratia liquefaciens]